MPNHRGMSNVYLEKRTTLPSFRNVTLADHVQQKTTQPALKKRWTKATGLGCRKFLSTLFACSKTPGLRRWPDNIRSIYKDIVKKTFSKEAFEMVMKSEDYTEWLKKTS